MYALQEAVLVWFLFSGASYAVLVKQTPANNSAIKIVNGILIGISQQPKWSKQDVCHLLVVTAEYWINCYSSTWIKLEDIVFTKYIQFSFNQYYHRGEIWPVLFDIPQPSILLCFCIVKETPLKVKVRNNQSSPFLVPSPLIICFVLGMSQLIGVTLLNWI